jgi:hypothetical protein
MTRFVSPTTHRQVGSRAAPVAFPRERSPRAQLLGALQRPWLQILLIGTVLFVALTRVTVDTHNVNLVPSVIVLGSFLIPLAFVMYVYERAIGGAADRGCTRTGASGTSSSCSSSAACSRPPATPPGPG